mgnify:CR=1 FL=1
MVRSWRLSLSATHMHSALGTQLIASEWNLMYNKELRSEIVDKQHFFSIVSENILIQYAADYSRAMKRKPSQRLQIKHM